MLIGFVLSIVVYYSMLSGLFAISFDPLVFSFAITGTLLYIAVIKYGFLKEAPIAFRTLFNSLDAAVLVFNQEELLTTFNSKASCVFGLKAAAVGNPITVLFKDWQQVLDWYKMPQKEEITVAAFDGSGHFTVSHIAIDGQHQKNGALMVFRDVSEKVAYTHSIEMANQQLVASELRFRNLVENINDTIFLLDGNGAVNYVSPNVVHNLGIEAKDLIGINFFACEQSKLVGESHSYFSQIITNKQAIKGLKFSYQRHDGATIWLLVNATPLLDEAGEVTRIIGLASDITDEILAQQKLAASENAARLLAQQYEEVLNNQSVFFIKISQEHTLVYANQCMAETMWDAKAPLNLAINVVFANEEHQKITTFIETAFENVGKPYSLVVTMRDFNGAERGVKWELKAVRYNEAAVCEIIGVGVEITEKLNNLKTTKHLLQTTTTQNERLQNFTYIISHNIRSHAANFMGLVNLVKDATAPKEVAEYIGLMEKSAFALDETLRNLNDVLSIQDNAVKVLVNLHLVAYIEKNILIFKQQIQEVDATLEVFVAPDIYVAAVAAYLDSVIFNLISNAIRYRSPNRKLLLQIAAHEEKGEVLLTITDNGLGIDLKKHGSKIFGLYQTFHQNKDARGLGLFITKAQIEGMQGTIVLESAPDKGTTIAIRINSANAHPPQPIV